MRNVKKKKKKKKKKMKMKCAAYLDSRKKHFEPPHDQTNKMTFAPSEDSDQPGHPPSLIRVFAVRLIGSLGRMPRVICVFAGRTDHYVGFVILRLNFHIETTSENIAYDIVTNLHMRN